MIDCGAHSFEGRCLYDPFQTIEADQDDTDLHFVMT
jgi:hypothetical protein